MKLTTPTIRHRLLKERGLVSSRPARRKHTKIVPTLIATGKYTPLMRYLEMRYGNGESMVRILLSGSLAVVRKKLGSEVDRSTLCRWIKRLKLRYGEDNLPECGGCQHHKPFCDLGVCNLLMELEQYDLVEPMKRKLMEVQHEGD